MLNYHFHVYGRVQGVGFRGTVYYTATKLGLTGFVRNENDGSVYIEIQGSAKAMQKFSDQLDRGMTPYARISKIEKTSGQLTDYRAFTIEY
ncbi:acylphosphatase [Limosilactobacillus difficilis]|uniref:acylphosphatase n=1 Tax=Limosilactobacillus difficilis TaxID=2991838 RepID=UPI0024B8AB32|nr:acylphosphatase [Limosilactobacillus difficilis]